MINCEFNHPQPEKATRFGLLNRDFWREPPIETAACENCAHQLEMLNIFTEQQNVQLNTQPVEEPWPRNTPPAAPTAAKAPNR